MINDVAPLGKNKLLLETSSLGLEENISSACDATNIERHATTRESKNNECIAVERNSTFHEKHARF